MTRRGVAPSGGYFSTAADFARFGQMVLRKGTGLDGRRHLTEAAVAEMTSKQYVSGQHMPVGLIYLDSSLLSLVQVGSY
jgi:CubicO group peptidase (beta-lactamase class C family)